jgi:hypothetical protein
MNVEQLDEFLKTTSFRESEVAELKGKNVKERNEYFQERIFWHRLVEVQNLLRESHVYLSKNGIFLMPEIKEHFMLIDNSIWNALKEREMEKETGQRVGKNGDCEKLRKDGEATLKALELIVRGRLHTQLP